MQRGGLWVPAGATVTARSALRELFGELAASTARWRLLGNPSVMARTWNDDLPDPVKAALVKVKLIDSDGSGPDYDQWDGYPAARDEIFGPVLSVIGYRDIDHAVQIANDSSYGLSGQVYSKDAATGAAIARRLRTGAVTVNSGVFSAYAPGGGYKQSGLGRERGPEGIRDFQEVKHIAIGELPA